MPKGNEDRRTFRLGVTTEQQLIELSKFWGGLGHTQVIRNAVSRLHAELLGEPSQKKTSRKSRIVS
jgi:hypothetical protein